MAKKELDMIVPEQWMKKTAKKPLILSITVCLASVFSLATALYLLHEQFLWNKRISTWNKVQGIIISNTREKISSGKRRKRVSKVLYQCGR